MVFSLNPKEVMISLNLIYHCQEACLSPYIDFLSLHTFNKKNPQVDPCKLLPLNSHLEKRSLHPFNVTLSHNKPSLP